LATKVHRSNPFDKSRGSHYLDLANGEAEAGKHDFAPSMLVIVAPIDDCVRGGSMRAPVIHEGILDDTASLGDAICCWDCPLQAVRSQVSTRSSQNCHPPRRHTRSKAFRWKDSEEVLPSA
jgi:hypothetical protein